MKEYVARRKERQNDIHHTMNESVDVVSTSLFLDAPGKKGFKVPILSDSVDEHVVQTLREIDAKKLKSATEEACNSEGTVEAVGGRCGENSDNVGLRGEVAFRVRARN